MRLLGHEWDEDLDNGFRPEGLVRLSETHVDNVQDWRVCCVTCHTCSGAVRCARAIATVGLLIVKLQSVSRRGLVQGGILRVNLQNDARPLWTMVPASTPAVLPTI